MMKYAGALYRKERLKQNNVHLSGGMTGRGIEESGSFIRWLTQPAITASINHGCRSSAVMTLIVKCNRFIDGANFNVAFYGRTLVFQLRLLSHSLHGVTVPTGRLFATAERRVFCLLTTCVGLCLRWCDV